VKTLITGVAGQDGLILAGQLAQSDSEIFGICREKYAGNLAHKLPSVNILTGDLTQINFVDKVLSDIKPDIVYNLAGFSSVRESWKFPEIATRINAGLPAQILSWSVRNKIDMKVIQASSSEIFGDVGDQPKNESSSFSPTTPYGLTKLLAHNLVIQYRNLYQGSFSNAILFNHESIYRKDHYVVRHITSSMARIHAGLQSTMNIGDLEAQRDWGWAPDYMNGIQLLAAKKDGDDFVFSTGELHSVREVIEICIDFLGLSDFDRFIVSEQSLLRQVDHKHLVGDSKKARSELGWEPTINFKSIVENILEHDLGIVGT
jgi:GDPmannose 4,6-dehydratase